MSLSPIRTQDGDSLHASDPFNVQVAEIGFVRKREADTRWQLTRCVNHRYDILAWVISGKAHYTCQEERFTVSRGQLLFFPRGREHSGISDAANPWSFCSVAVELRDAEGGECRALRELPCRVQAEDPVAIAAMCSELDKLWIAKENGHLLRIRGIIYSLLYAFVQGHQRAGQQKQHTRRIGPIVKMLQGGFRRSYSVDELAEMADLSPSRFAVLFKDFTGQSVVRYQNWLRMNKARDLLLSGEYSVSHAAEVVGFTDVYYFSRLFKKMMG